MQRTFIVGGAVAAIVAASGVAFATQAADPEKDAVADLAKASVTLGQAVTTAEAQLNGRATRAALDSEGGAVAYRVEVVAADNRVFDLRIDATDGKVLSSRQDAADRKGEDQDQDEDND